MKDDNIKTTVDNLKEAVDNVNKLMQELHQLNVEVRISYKESENGQAAWIDLWRVIEHNNYLKEN